MQLIHTPQSSVFNLVEEDVEGESYLTSGPLMEEGKAAQTRALNLDLPPTDVAGKRRASLERKMTIKPFRCACDVMTSLMNLQVVSGRRFKEGIAPC